jgi:hypothetical protein
VAALSYEAKKRPFLKAQTLQIFLPLIILGVLCEVKKEPLCQDKAQPAARL